MTVNRNSGMRAWLGMAALAAALTLASAAEAKTLRFAIASFAEETYDPTVTSASAAIGIGGGLWNGLTEVTSKGDLKPSVALSWSQDPSGLAWTFKLRDDVKFHDGTKMTAEDIRFSIMNGALRPEGKSSRVAQFRKAIKDIKVVDPTTVRFELNGPWPTLPYDLSCQSGNEGMILPKAYIEKVGWAEFAKHPIGTGPWKFVAHKAGNMAEFTAVKDHFATPPKFDALQILLVPEASTRTAMLKAGQVDIVDAQIDSIKDLQASGFSIAEDVQRTSIRVQLIGSDLATDAPIHKLEVRKALNLAINRAEIVKEFFNGRAEPAAVFPINPLSIGFPKDLQPYPYDPALAKKLIAEAGYPNGFEIKLFAFSVSSFEAYKAFAEAIAGYWEAIGVKTTIVLTDLGALRPKWVAQPPHSDILGQAMLFATNGRPNGYDDLSVFWYFTPRGIMRMAAKGEIDDAMDRGSKARTVEELSKAIGDAYHILYKNYRGIPVVNGLSGVWGYGNQLASFTDRRPYRAYITPDLAMAVPK